MSKTRQVLGKVLITFEGEFNSSTQYEQLDIVTYQGSTYIAKQDTKGNLPTDTSYFALLVQKPIKGTDYFTAQEIEDIVSEITDDANSVFNQNVTEKTTAFNNNASSKTSDFNAEVSTQISVFGRNAANMTDRFDNHVSGKTTEFDSHVTSKTSDFDSHVTTKITEFDSNASDKITEFNSNAASKTTDFNDNATLKTTEFNNNANYLSNTLNKYKTIHNAMPKVEDEGSDIALNETADGVFMDILPEGNSSQEEITDNLFDNTWESGGIDGSTGTLNGDGQVRTKNYIRVFFNHLYSISRSISTSYMVLRFYDIDFNYLGSQTTSSGLITTNKSSNRMDVGVSDMTFTVINKNVAYMKIADASNNSSTIYTLTTNAINPDYPSDIKLVTGRQNVKLQTKNYFDLNTLTHSNCTHVISNKSVIVTATYTYGYIKCKCENLDTSKQYILAFKGDSASWITVSNSNDVKTNETYNSKSILFRPQTSTIFIRIYVTTSESSGKKTFTEIQLEKGNQSTSHVFHKGKKYQLDFSGENIPLEQSVKLAGIGNYKDFIFKNEIGSPYYNENLTLNSWYKKKYFNELIFDGRTAGKRLLNPHSTITAENKGFFLKTITDKSIKLGNGNINSLLCNYLKEVSGDATIAFNNNDSGVWWEGLTQNIYVILPFTTQIEANEWLAELYDAGKPLVMVYLLNEPVDELITDTVLIEQLENLNNNARSHGETTIISCGSDDENNATLVTKSVAVKDLNTVLDNINNAILEIGGGE